jgi:hypothetical protein
MNERDAYRLARAFAEVKESRRAVRALTAEPKYPDAYVSDDADTAVVRALLERGFRWIRTEGELAVFEKEVPR